MINVKKLSIPEIIIIDPQIFNDERGYFFESYNDKVFSEAIGRQVNFVQDNQSLSKKGVLRGLHFQEVPFAQAKLVRVLHGEVWDVAVDIRQNSPTYGKWVAENLSADNKKQIWIPEGFAHGFCVLSEFAVISYKVNQYYSKHHEKTIHWFNNSFDIDWPVNQENILLSKKDDTEENE